MDLGQFDRSKLTLELKEQVCRCVQFVCVCAQCGECVPVWESVCNCRRVCPNVCMSQCRRVCPSVGGCVGCLCVCACVYICPCHMGGM